MVFKTFTDRIRRSFSQSAQQYDLLTGLHKEIGRELVQKVVKLNAPVIVDIGCGTGYVTNKAKSLFPESRVIGVDIAEGMIIEAKTLHDGTGIEWVCADAAALPFTDSEMDLIVSNVAYQWMESLPQALMEAARVLKSEGVFNITLFGARTCEELFSSLAVLDSKVKLRHLPSVEKTREALLAAGFKDINVDFELIKVQFGNVMELLVWLKAIGANHVSEHPVFLGKHKIAQLHEYYREHFPYNEGICSTFEVIWVYAKK